jgi:hypothetical protein
MAIKYIDIFHCKTLHNLSKLGFLFLKYVYHLATLTEDRGFALLDSTFRST